MPGMWSVTFSVQQQTNSRHSISSRVPFLVTPLLPVTPELQDVEYLKRLHGPGQMQPEGDNDSNAFLENDGLESDELLLAQAIQNAEKDRNELKSWITDLASSFYTVEAICGVKVPKSHQSPKFKLLPKCFESEWSTHYPDEKSRILLHS